MVPSETSTPWPEKTVVFQFSDKMSDKQQKKVKREMRYIEKRTSIKFREKKASDTNYAKITCTTDWGQAGIGMKGIGEQQLDVGKKFQAQTIKHELCHTIGLRHEHQRLDRDAHIKVYMDRIDKKSHHNFVVKNFDTYGQPYDHLSIMHYAARFDGKICLEHKKPRRKKMSGRVLTKFDIAKIEKRMLVSALEILKNKINDLTFY